MSSVEKQMKKSVGWKIEEQKLPSLNNREEIKFLNEWGASLVEQWLRLHTLNAGGPGSISGQGTRSHMHAQPRVCMPQLRSPHATTKESTCCN